MEKKCVRIVSQQALVERDWTNSQGEKITIASKEMEFSDGIDSFVAEATDRLPTRWHVTWRRTRWPTVQR